MPGVPEPGCPPNPAALEPPTQIGGCGRRVGLRQVATSPNDTKRPFTEATSPAHSSVMAARYSSVIAPRWPNGTPSAANSGSDQPTPTPNTNRPPLNRSMLAAIRAVSSGWRYGRSATVVPNSMCSVCPASQARVTNGAGRNRPSVSARA